MSCSITQSNSSGSNLAGVYQNATKMTGLTQTATLGASITQQAGSGSNTACVDQEFSIAGNTVAKNGTPVNVNIAGYQTVQINQDSSTGTNSAAQSATPSGGCTGTTIVQSQSLSSVASGSSSITQNEDAQATNADLGPNLVLNIQQNGLTPSASGLNNASFTQTSNQTAIANAANGSTVNQTQSATESQPLFSGIVGTLNQVSTGVSTANVTQNETQCEDAVNTKNSAALTVCSNTSDGPIPGISLTQTQYGPEGVFGPSPERAGHAPFVRKGAGRVVPFVHKGYGSSTQSSNPGDTFTLTQNSTQNTDSGSTQSNVVQGDCHSTGSCTAGQTANVNNASTTAGWTAPSIPDVHINCASQTCTATPPPVPTINPTSEPSTVVEAGSGATTFTWSDFATAGVDYQCSTDDSTWTSCTSGDSNATFANTTAGTYSFYVRAVNSTGTLNSSAPASFTWNVVDANVSIAATPPTTGVSEVGNSQTFTITTNGLPAGTTGTLTSITPAITGGTESDTCGTPTMVTSTEYQCTVTVNDTSAATVTVTATAAWQFTDGVNSVDVSRSTDGTHGSSNGATAQFVDAYITLSPLTFSQTAGTNTQMTATVYVNDGSGSGYVLTGGVPVTFSLNDNDSGAMSVFDPSGVNTCTTSSVNDSTLGTCSVTVDSGDPGQTTVNASFTNLNVDGASLSRATGDTLSSDSPDAVITWTTGRPFRPGCDVR